MNDISLSRLIDESVQSSYKEIHALIDELGDTEPESRRERLFDFFLEKRHLFVRLLITVRWYMNYSAFHSSARTAANFASSRSLVFVRDADSMAFISESLKRASTIAPSLQEAAEVLGAAPVFNRLPRIISDAIGLDSHAILHNIKPPKALEKSTKCVNVYAEPDNADVSFEEDVTGQAIERLAVLTRRVIGNSLPKGVRIIETAVPPDGTAVRIGVLGAWTADIIISGLKLDEASLHVYRFKILVDSHVDSPSRLRSRWRNDQRPTYINEWEQRCTRQMLDERMLCAMTDAKWDDQKEKRFQLALQSLATTMSTELCAELVMWQIRAELSTILTLNFWTSAGITADGRFRDPGKNIPARIHYWPDSHTPSTLSIAAAVEDKDANSIVHLHHKPPLPIQEEELRIDYEAVDVQKLILDCGRIRAMAELSKLQDRCASHFGSSILCSTEESHFSSLSLLISFDGHGLGLALSMSLASGGFSLMSKGILQLALSYNDPSCTKLQALLWKGVRFFRAGGLNVLWKILEKILKMSMLLLRRFAAVRAMSAAGCGAMKQWPPGVPSVENPSVGSVGGTVSPPLVLLDRKRPRCFLSLDSVASPKGYRPGSGERLNSKRPRVQFNFTESDELYFFEGRIREDQQSPLNTCEKNRTAQIMATWMEIQHDMWLRLKRDKISKMLAANKIMPALPREADVLPTHRTPIDVKTLPLETDKAVLVVGENDTWGVELTLTNDIFDDDGFTGFGASYCRRTRLLKFFYPSVTKPMLKYFGRDLMRARTAATISLCLRKDAKEYKVLKRCHSHIVLETQGIRVGVGLGASGMEVGMWPAPHIFKLYLVPLMEELLMESRKKMGHSLAGMLLMSVPIGLALQNGLPEDTSSYRLKFLSVLRVRVALTSSRKNERERGMHCLEVDARYGVQRVHVSDYGRVSRLIASRNGSGAAVAAQFVEVGKWNGIVKALVERKMGKVHSHGATVEINMNILGKFLSAIVKNL